MRSDRTLRVIAVYKFLKSALLVAVGLGALRLLRPEVGAWAERWASALALRHAHRLLSHVLVLVSGLSPRRLHAFALGAFLFALLFAVEGTGLWLRKRWAEYLTVIATTLFIPLEIFELVHRVTVPRVSALLVNLAVVALLVSLLRPAVNAETA